MDCPVCALTATLQLGGGTEVAVGTVAAVLERRPLLACAQAHDHSPEGAIEQGMAAVDAQLPRCRVRRLRGDGCSNCSTRLDLPVRRTRRTVTIAVDDLPVHTLHLDVPMTRCADCGLDQVPGRSHEDLAAAVRAAYAPPDTG